jgi:hypothetical protein
MGRKQEQSPLATVTKIPARRRPGRPYKTLSSAVARSGDERDVLLLLRKRIAAPLDGDDQPPAAFGALVRQFQQVDAKIRAIDAQEAEAAETDDEDDEDDGDAAWDPSNL